MKAGFWHERWESDQLGFHQEAVNGLLVELWPRLGLAADATVFVPLCGKSRDMHWLRERGHEVIGVELSPIAVRDFFSETGIEAGSTPHGALERFEGGGYRLFCGDLFELGAAELAEVRGVYDRASLIALPPAMRRDYATHLRRILPARCSILLITLDYDPTRMDGPPHSVPVVEVEALFGGSGDDAFAIEPLWSSGPVEPPAPFPERGLDRWTETVLHLERGAGT